MKKLKLNEYMTPQLGPMFVWMIDPCNGLDDYYRAGIIDKSWSWIVNKQVLVRI